MRWSLLGLTLAVAAVADEKKDKKIGTVIGIDLGTTYSSVGVYRNRRVEIITNDRGNQYTPSYVAFTADGERLIGDAAKNQLTTNPENTVFDIKRLIGRDWGDITVQHDVKFFPFKVIKKQSKLHVQVQTAQGQNVFTPKEISAMILTKMKENAEAYLGKKVSHAVVSVAAYFNDAQRQATMDAGAIAGLQIMKIINDPTAAAIAYGFNKMAGEKNVLVFDLGGGTFDVSLLTIDNGVFKVVATNGDTHLGGEDFDQRVMEHFIRLYQKKGKDIRKDNRTMQKLRRAVENAKRALSSRQQVEIEIKSFFEGEDFFEILTRAKFEELNIDRFRLTLKSVQKVLEDSNIDKKDVDEIVLVGGSTRIPKVQQLVKEFFDDKELFRGINPYKAVAYGAAVQAGLLSGEIETDDIALQDVNPFTIGVGISGDIMTKLIPRNTIIPTKKTQIFTTAKDNQLTITIPVYEGEHLMTKDNHLIENFDWTGIPPAPQGMPRIKVTFEIDANGILHIFGEKRGTASRKKNVITNDQKRLTPKNIKRINKDAEEFADDYKAKKRTKPKDVIEKIAHILKKRLHDKRSISSTFSNEIKSNIIDVIDAIVKWYKFNKVFDPEAHKTLKKTFEDFVLPIVTKKKLGQGGVPPPGANEEEFKDEF